YVPWSSWASVSTIWPNAVTSGPKPLTSIEGESSGLGTYTHELTHNLGILDNYSNPYSTPYQRGFTGMWDMMSRGSFNGPGGPHTRFEVPPTGGRPPRPPPHPPQQPQLALPSPGPGPPAHPPPQGH